MKKLIALLFILVLLGGCSDIIEEYRLCCERNVIEVISDDIPRMVLLSNRSGYTRLYYSNTLLVGQEINVCLSVKIK